LSIPKSQLPTPKGSRSKELGERRAGWPTRQAFHLVRAIGFPWEFGVGRWESTLRAATGLALALVLSACSWWQGDKALITQRLNDLVEQINVHTDEGIAAIARAARIGQFFTDDVIVELGRGSTPVTGRDTLMSMIARLEPRTAAFKVKLIDVNIHLTPADQSADINLTAEILRQSAVTGDPSMDAREFTLIMRKVDGEWRIARLTAVDTLK
jgi:SnoaL-like protein